MGFIPYALLQGGKMKQIKRSKEALIQAIQQAEIRNKQGHLKIFFGYADGVGKTCAMLQAAYHAKHNGMDVVVGYLHPEIDSVSGALLKDLECLPTKQQKTSAACEFDLDAALMRCPQLILVDELAHINGEGCRHARRYQDIEELLKSGIDVYTTINVQNIESLTDTVASITGILAKDRIPDSIFDRAYQVELVDMEPEELLERIHAESTDSEGFSKRLIPSFYTLDNLTALRELALRRCADRLNLLTKSARRVGSAFYPDEHILVCLSSAPSNAKIVRTAARMAAAFRSNFTALFVETPSFSLVSARDKKRLHSNIHLAEQLGAKVETVYGEDVPYQIAEYARLSGVSRIVIGRSSAKRRHFFGKPTLTERLIEIAPNLDIHIIPDAVPVGFYKERKLKKHHGFVLTLSDTLKSLLILTLATIIGFAFSRFDFTKPNIITVYILAVLIISVVTGSSLYSLISSAISVLIFNFFFTLPTFTFMAYDKGYPLTFLIMFIAALLTSSLAAKLKSQAAQSAQAAYRTKVLLDTNQLLQKAACDEEIITITANQLMKLLNRDIIVYPVCEETLGKPYLHFIGEKKSDILAKDEKTVAEWVLKNNHHAGATTNTLGSAKCLYLSIRAGENVYGVVGIRIEEMPLDTFENNMLLSILGECALALENSRNVREKEQAAVFAKNEQLRANLLRTISHDLRTPLTSISGNASNLFSNGQAFDDRTRKQIYADIYDDAMWLINLVENLLSVTRIEEGRMNLNLSAQLMDEVIAEALKHINRKSAEHHITVKGNETLLLAKMDARLIVQVIINLVDNAIKYTPSGSNICIYMEKLEKFIAVSIADDGPGIADEGKSRIFDMFYSGTNKVADSRRSLGLGLFLCKSIIAAHGGTICVQDNQPKGSIFTLTIPAGEVELHE